MSSQRKENLADEFKVLFPGTTVRTDHAWSQITSLGIGSARPLIIEPPDDIQLMRILKFCSASSIRVFPLGGGSNVIGTDNESPSSIVIRLSSDFFRKIKFSHVHVNVGAGIRLFDLLKLCAEKSLGGASPLAGIPGTLGGAIRMNAGTRDCETGLFTDSVCGCTLDGELWSGSGSDVKWAYRHCSVPENVIITGAIMRFNPVNREEELEKIKDTVQWRKDKTPSGKSAGCIFKNPATGISAGKLLETSGCREIASKNLHLAPEHANYFINKGDATENEICSLISASAHKVFDETGIILRTEVRFASEEMEQKLLAQLPKCKIALLKGGTSSEREISLKSGAFVADALRSAGYDVSEFDVKSTKITSAIKKCGLVFPVLHGGFGENGEIQAELENNGLEFVGSGSKSSAVCIDKIKSKNLMRKAGIPTPEDAVVTKDNQDFPKNLSLPVIVKPPCEGSTVGITIVHSMDQWDEALKKGFCCNSGELLVESFIKGKEITVGLLGGKALPVIEIRYPGEMYDFDAKYTHLQGDTLYLCPPQSIPEEQQTLAREIAERFYRAIDARDLLRVDMMISDSDGKIYVLEGNNIPGFTESSLLPKAAGVAGISFVELCARLANFAEKRRRQPK